MWKVSKEFFCAIKYGSHGVEFRETKYHLIEIPCNKFYPDEKKKFRKYGKENYFHPAAMYAPH
jgi:hypothetical protein